MEPKAPRYKPQKTWMTFAIIASAIAIFLAAGSYIVFSKKPAKVEGSSTQGLKPSPKTKIGGEGTQPYNELVEKGNEQKAEEAAKTGSSVFPDIIGKEFEPVVVEKIRNTPEPKVVKQVKAPAPEEIQTKAPEKDTEYDNFIKQYSKAINDAVAQDPIIGKSRLIEFNTDKNKETKQSSEKTSEKTEPPKPALNLKPGDQLYVSNIIAVNSDVPSLVHGEIVSGEYTRGKLFGQFERHDKFLLVKFNKLEFQGFVYQIEAIAFDPDTMSAAVRSNVDSHYLERWGGLIAASFLEGFGEAVEKSGTTTTNNFFGSTQSYPDYSLQDQAWIAAGKVGTRMADIMAKNFNRPPTVYLNNGNISIDGMIGVLFLGAKDK